MRAFFLDRAQADLIDALAYFERQSSGLGGAFLDQVEEALQRIEDFPRAWPRINRKLRICQLKRFRKYGLLYRVGKGAVFIHRIVHLQRGPGFWKKVLS